MYSLEAELARLNKNKERRHIRDRQKGKVGPESAPGTPGSPNGPSLPGSNSKAAGTQRRCANCGQVGHIRTNKKLCPALQNKDFKNKAFDDAAFGGSSAAGAVGSAGSPVASTPTIEIGSVANDDSVIDL